MKSAEPDIKASLFKFIAFSALLLSLLNCEQARERGLFTIHDGIMAAQGRHMPAPGTGAHELRRTFGFRDVSIPENFSKKWDLGTYKGWLSITFLLPPELVKKKEIKAFNAGRLSDISKIYLNGELVGGKGNVNPYQSGALRPQLIFLPERLVVRGKPNRITVQLYSQRGRYYIEALDHFQLGPAGSIGQAILINEAPELAFLAIYLAVAVYHLLLAWRRPGDRYHLYFSIFVIMVSFYWFVANTISRDLLFGEYIDFYRQTEHMLLHVVPAPLFFFLARFLHRSFEKPAWFMLVVGSLLSIGSIFVEPPGMRMATNIWYVAFFVVLPWFAFLTLREIIQKNKDAMALGLGILILVAGTANDILVSLSVIYSPRISSYGLFVFIVGLELIMANRFVSLRNQEERLLTRITRLSLELTRKNIQPHFLMNSLNVSIELFQEEPAAAQKMLQALADEIRGTLSIVNKTLIPLEEEVLLCRKHLEIMSLRKGKDFKLETQGNLKDYVIPPLLLLTLVENGITHGYRGKERGVFILSVKAMESEAELKLFNDSRMRPADLTGASSGTGSGLRYVRSRLQEAYEDEFSLEFGFVENGYEVNLRFPRLMD